MDPHPGTPASARIASQARHLPRARWTERAAPLVQPLLAFLTLLILWEIVIRVLSVPQYLFPSPLQIVRAGIANLPRIWINYSTTLRSAFLGYLLAVAVAVPASLIIAYSAFAERAFFPGLVMLHMTPKVTLAPIIIAWLGFGLLPKVVVTALLCFMPIMLNGILGFRTIDPEVIYLAQSCGASGSDTFWKIRLPNALPTLFTGLKHAASLALVGAVVAEFIGGNRGLGYYLVITMDAIRTDLGLAIVTAMTTIGLGFFFGMQLIENLAIPWHVSKRRRGGL